MNVKENAKNVDTWIRGLFILIFGVIFYFLYLIIWLLVIFQFLFNLFYFTTFPYHLHHLLYFKLPV